MEESTYSPRSEVRFAVVMYGGVSLAIYINGVAQELFRLVRATAPNETGDRLAIDDDDLSPLEAVYREIGRRRVGDTFWNSQDDSDLEEGVATRFVVDIVSGTSAGGINGILLSKALANGLKGIDALKDLWIKEGEFADLLNEKRAYDGLDDFRYVKPPSSLLAGDRLFSRALEAIAGMVERDDGVAPRYADQVDLAVTMTDLQGVWLPIRLADGTVSEPRHRAVLRFAFATDGAGGIERNDFDETHDRMLAFAARATSSFPVAFAPIALDDINPNPSVDERRLFNDWIQVGADFGSFAFADGGYLYNKPFSHATEVLRRRRDDRPISRKLLYVEPDPAVVPKDRNEARPRPDAIANAGLALVGLPGAQPIRDDLKAVEERNAALRRIGAVTRKLHVALVSQDEPPAVSAPAALVYQRLRRAEVVDDLAETFERAVDLPPAGDATEVARLLFRAHAGESDQDLPAYLGRLDMRYRLRRISYLQELLDELSEGGQSAQLLIERSGLAGFNAGNSVALIRAAKSGLDASRVALSLAARGVRARGVDASSVAEDAAWLANVCLSNVEEVMSATDPELAAGELLAQPDVAVAVGRFTDAVAEELEEAFNEADRLNAALLPRVNGQDSEALEAMLERAYARVETLDSAVFPLRWPTLGEARKVDVHRVSPRDAESLVRMPDLGPDGKPTGPSPPSGRIRRALRRLS